MSIDHELRRAGESTRDSVGAALNLDARLADLKATSRRRRGIRAVAALASVAAAVAVTGLVSLGVRTPDVVDPATVDRTVSCREALADTFSPSGTVQCLGGRVVLVRGPVDYTFRLPRDVPWRIDAAAAPWAVNASMDPWADSAGISVVAGVRAAAGGESGRELTAAGLASWIASRRFLVATPVAAGAQDAMPTWTVEVRPRPGLPRPGPARACSGVDTDCHALLTWQQGSSFNENGDWDGQVVRLTFLDVPGRGVVALIAWADFGSTGYLDGAARLLRSVDFVLPAD